MKIGIISDSHDDFEHAKKAVEIFKKEKTELVFHLGDIISPPVARLFSGLKVIAVLGNNDGSVLTLVQAFNEIEGEIKGNFGSFEIDKLKIAIYHGEFMEISEALAKSGNYDAVFTGHFHITSVKTIGKTLWVAIGSANKEFAENSRPVVGIFETKTRNIEFIRI